VSKHCDIAEFIVLCDYYNITIPRAVILKIQEHTQYHPIE